MQIRKDNHQKNSALNFNPVKSSKNMKLKTPIFK